jgi:single-strand DNA-binding protein
MPSLNSVTMVGNLCRDPEVRTVGTGTTVADLRVAINDRIGEKDITVFVDVVAWGKTAEWCGKHSKKGDTLMVYGRLQYEEWEKDGKRASRLRVRAERVFGMSKTGRDTGEGGEEWHPENDNKRRRSSVTAPPAPTEPETDMGDEDDLPAF